jgi:hypothetical protein
MGQAHRQGSELMKNFSSDVDLDFGDRGLALKYLKHVPASIMRDDQLVPHNTGIYVTDIPLDPFLGISALDHRTAEQRGYVKLDFLNVSLYTKITSETELDELISQAPDWDRFNTDQGFFEQLIHVGNHWRLLKQMPQPVDTIARLAMFLAIIRPAKRHLVGLPWKEVSKTIWEKSNDGSYGFKKSHSISYAHLIVVNMNLLVKQGV